MSNSLNSRSNDLPIELVRLVGIGSDIGDQMISYLEDQLERTSDRSRVITEWQIYIISGGNMGNENVVGINGTKLIGDETIFCRQVYYTMVVLLVAWSYLARKHEAFLDSNEVLLDSLINGQVFEPMGLSNLRLEDCPSGYGLGIKGMPYPLSRLLESVMELDLRPHGKGDLFRPLYENLLPPKVRHALGEHYTPEWLVSHMLDQVGFHGGEGETLIDPACGSGVFLMEAWSRKRSNQGSRNDWGSVVGMDVNPLAVLAAKVNYLIAANYQVGSHQFEIPVYLRDVILSDDDGLWSEPSTPYGDTKFDFVVGNPPWINWESLSPGYRMATLGFWKKYGLFSHSGMDTILGKGKKDFSTLMTLSCAKQFLKPKGKLAFLITQGVFKSGGAAEGFRSFSLPDKTKLKVLMVEDLSRFRPFAGASNRTAILYMEKDLPTEYPIPYLLWTHLSTDAMSVYPHKEVLDLVAEPVNPAEIRSPWMTYQKGCRESLRKILGTSEYTAREGANTGGANGILWVEVIDRPQPGLVRVRNLAESSRKNVPVTEAVIEENLVYPLLKGVDVTRWQARPSAHIILTQDPGTRRGISLIIMARNYPRTLEYLKHFKTELSNRAAYRRYFRKSDPFYTMFNVGEYTLAPYKIVWHRFGNRMKAAVVEGIDRPVIPQETHTMVACESREEAWYLAGVLNSLPVEYALSSYSIVGGKSFAGPNLLKFMRIPLYTGSRTQDKISEAARKVANGEGSDFLLAEAVAEFYEISFSQLQGMKKGWEELGLKPLATQLKPRLEQ